jgi:eukaryotic-like serine/threonine-protein kinase
MSMRLNAAEWARVESLFPQAAELARPERARFLDRECAGAPRVRAELEAMLEAVDSNDPLFEAPIGLTAPGEDAGERLPAGTRLGSWKIKDLIGHGGMGEVYLAERADGAYSMNAAIKLLKRQLFSYANAQRFLRERRVLARLAHPNIARGLDAGTTDDGRPYLVMEHVDGVRVTDHAQTRRLDPRGAARLMLAVAEAVAEAHRHGVVHRDLKPANVMVTHEQQVKLLDFGIAKLMEEPDAATPGAVPMTPAYAAPEQILGQPLTPATDVWALGVMLFQLLTHRLPHRREGLPLPVIAAGLRDETVDRPSRVVLDSTALFGEATRRRQAQALAGDLDWIALKALQADPKRRYPEAGELAADLRRYLEHFPVLARQDSLAYRTSRFVRRYPTQVSATAIGVGALAIGLAAALWQAQVARGEAQRAERVKEFVLSLFAEQDPEGRAQAQALEPAELIARGLARADAELAHDRALHATLLNDLGEIQANVGDPAGGVATLERALAARAEQHGADSVEVAATLHRLAHALALEGRHQDEEARLREALAILERRDALDTAEAAMLQLRLAYRADRGRARGAGAAEQLLAAQRVLEAQRGAEHPDTLRALEYRGQVLEQARQDAEALAVFRDLLGRVERVHGAGSARLIGPLYSMLPILKRSGAHDEAEQTFVRAVALQRTHYGPVHPQLADLLRSWADLEQTRFNLARAEELFREAEAALPPSAAPRRRGELLKDRGQLMLAQGRFAEAERDLRAAVEGFRAAEGDGSGFTWFVTGEWGRALLGLGRVAEAESVQREAAARLAAIMGPDAYQNALLADALADTLEQRGQWVEAVDLRRRALALTEARYAPDHRLVAARGTKLATALVARGQGDPEAAALLDRAIPVLRTVPAEQATLAQALAVRGRLFAKAREVAAARPLLQEAVRLFEALPVADDHAAEARRWLARAGG